MSQSNRPLVNGGLRVEPKHVNQLQRQLNDTQRQLLLSQEVVKQFERITETQNRIKDLSTRLLRQREDPDLDDEEELERQKKELNILEKKLQMLRSVEQRDPKLDVQLLAVKKIKNKNKFLILDKEVSLSRSEDNSSEVRELDNDSDATDVDDQRSRNWSGSTEAKSQNSHSTANTGSVEDELGELVPRRGHRSGRRSAIPERFASFPEGYGSRKLFTGLIGVLFVALVGTLIVFYMHRTDPDLVSDSLNRAYDYYETLEKGFKSRFGF